VAEVEDEMVAFGHGAVVKPGYLPGLTLNSREELQRSIAESHEPAEAQECG
jgi:hypothetical protein